MANDNSVIEDDRKKLEAEVEEAKNAFIEAARAIRDVRVELLELAADDKEGTPKYLELCFKENPLETEREQAWTKWLAVRERAVAAGIPVPLHITY